MQIVPMHEKACAYTEITGHRDRSRGGRKPNYGSRWFFSCMCICSWCGGCTLRMHQLVRW